MTKPTQTPTGSPAVSLTGRLTLEPWQEIAVQRWITGDDGGPHRGTLEIFTGGGKTLIALAAFARVSNSDREARLAVVVPTEALARQWVTTIVKETTLSASDVGLLGAGGSDTFAGKRALVAVLNTAARQLPGLAASLESLMLVVDECHRAGALTFSKVLSTPAKYRLGLSATPARDEVDETGLPLRFDSQVVGRMLGDIVFRFGLKEAREIGWLPDYIVHHHGVRLTEGERTEYERISRKVSDAADRLTSAGYHTSQAWHLAARGGEVASVAQGYVGALAVRKDFLYRVSERSRVAAIIVERAMRQATERRVLLFHERVAEAQALFKSLQNRIPNRQIALEHSDLPESARKEALASFRSGKVNVLVSVKSLVEGIDVPDADVGVSVASSSSVRQRIQTLGRVLRRRFDGGHKSAEMHVIYVHDTVDESIYGKEDWSDITGAAANRYWLYPLDPELVAVEQPGPPLTPRPTEEAEWKRFGEQVPENPEPWLGELPDYEFSVDTRGNVTTSEGAWIENPQNIPAMIESVRGKPGGRFRVTPIHNLVIVFGDSPEGMIPFLAGRLLEPFRLRTESNEVDADPDVRSLKPGSLYTGPTDRREGSFKIRQKRGGVIERKVGDVTQFAITEGQSLQAQDARDLLDAWRSMSTPGLTFFVNHLGHAWFREEGTSRFLGVISQGLSWPELGKPPETHDTTLPTPQSESTSQMENIDAGERKE